MVKTGIVLALLVAVASAGDHEHCPPCGDLTCPHGFNAQQVQGQCCPLCVSIDGKSFPDEKDYTQLAGDAYKEYTAAAWAGNAPAAAFAQVASPAAKTEHCPKCGDLTCPHGFTSQQMEGQCCPLCMRTDGKTFPEEKNWAQLAGNAYKEYTAAAWAGNAPAAAFAQAGSAAPAKTSEHCPKCGDLTCPHGFTSQQMEGQCCPLCMRTDGKTFPEEKDWTQLAGNAYKEYTAAAWAGNAPAAALAQVSSAGDHEHCPPCGDLTCPHGFNAQQVQGQCCPLCVSIDGKSFPDEKDYTTLAGDAYKEYTAAAWAGNAPASA